MSTPAALRAPGLGFLAGLFAIVAAWGFELIGGYLPCKLCLEERIPYYVGLPILVVGLLLATRVPVLARGLYVVSGVIFFAGSALAAYHVGAEWKLWEGPSDCGGAATVVNSAADLMAAVRGTRLVSCSEASINLFGLSFAGWDVLSTAFVGLMSWRGVIARRSALI
jgi:disulfide bond formation protein DsbB